MRFLLRSLFLLCITFFAQAKDYNYSGIKPAVIIDVRTAEEFTSGHIEGAVNIPYEQIVNGITSIKAIKKDSPILIYCRSGRRSSIAVQTLKNIGYKKIYDGGGMQRLQANLKPCNIQSC